MAYHTERTYRLNCQSEELLSFSARVKETDLWILARSDLTRLAEEYILNHRRGLEIYTKQNPGFLSSLTPLPPDPLAPALVKAMLEAGQSAGTGPMAAVAGVIAQYVGQDLLNHSDQVVVENGGDIYMATKDDLTVGIWAGKSPLSGRLGIRIPAGTQPICLATSSGTVGHSLSLGRADAATILACDGALADATATALGNRVQTKGDLKQALEWAAGVEGVLGALIIIGDKLAAFGNLELCSL